MVVIYQVLLHMCLCILRLNSIKMLGLYHIVPFPTAESGVFKEEVCCFGIEKVLLTKNLSTSSKKLVVKLCWCIHWKKVYRWSERVLGLYQTLSLFKTCCDPVYVCPLREDFVMIPFCFSSEVCFEPVQCFFAERGL